MNSNDRLRDELLVLVGFLLTSARGLVDERTSYGPARLLDAAGRLLALMDEQDMLDVLLKEIRAQIDRQLFGSWDEEHLQDKLDELALRWTALIADRI